VAQRTEGKDFLEGCERVALDGVRLRRAFLEATRLHWGVASHHGELEAELGCLLYSDDPKKRKLNVELMSIFDPAKVDAFPGVFVGLAGGVTYRKVAVGNMSFHSDDGATTGYVQAAEAILLFRHVGRSADQALMMAQSTADFLQGAWEPLTARLGLRAMDVQGFSDSVLVKGAPERFFMSDARATVAFEHAITVVVESLRLRDFAIEGIPALPENLS